MNSKAIGFTGTRDGMSAAQQQNLRQKLEDLHGIFEWFHHGDCVGADAQAHKIALDVGYYIAIHPPKNETARAFCQDYNRIYDAEDYLVRNHKIVDETVCLLAAPFTSGEMQRSGTWATIRYAKHLNRSVCILLRNGGGRYEI